MITMRRSGDRGHFDHGWLDTWHTFSFADYHDPEQMGFSKLRVLNQDRIQPGQGFGTHGHRNMEIITYVLDGVLEHRDSMDNGSRIHPGEIQLMSAGSGVTHSEFNGSDRDRLHLLQMWVLPERTGTPPRYDRKRFPEAERRGRLRLLVSPDGRDGSIVIGQDVNLFGGLLRTGESVRQDLDPARSAWLHVARGRLKLNGTALEAGDGAGIRGESRLEVAGGDAGGVAGRVAGDNAGDEAAEFVLFDLP